MSDEVVNRKDFLKKGFFRFFNFLHETVGEIGALSYSPIRPPGALEEKFFLDTCVKCGSCIKACEQKSISFSGIEANFLMGFPIIDPKERPCFVCDDLSCMKACPSGALKLTERQNIQMGIAIVDIDKCITYKDKNCSICVSSCPFPEIAISIDENKHPDVKKSCIGCGLCEYWCDYDAIKIKSNR